MPTDYISELARRADERITPEEWRASDKLRICLTEKPANALQLAQELESRPELQAQIAWHIGFTPSQWLLEHELGQIDARRSGQGIFGVEKTGERMFALPIRG